MYTCGPTVYNYVHIGNLRTFAFQDILRRWLRYRGFQLDHVMNITDVEDKIIRSALQQGKGLREYTEVYEKAFLEDADTSAWNGRSEWCVPPSTYPRWSHAIETAAGQRATRT